MILKDGMFSFCGLTKGSPGTSSVLETEAPYWIYRYERSERPGIWTKILPSTPPESTLSPTSAYISDVPLPRFAHQVVYNTSTKTIYMHGGNGLGRDVVVTAGDTPMESQRESGAGGGEGEENASRETRYRVMRHTSTMTESIAEYEHETEPTEDNDRLDDFWTMRLQR